MKKILISLMTIISLFILSGCANAGKDQLVNVGDIVILDGSASEAKYGWTILKYKWKQIKGKHVQLENKNTSIATFIAPDIGNKKQKRLVFLLTTTEKSPIGTIHKSYDKVKVFVKSNTSSDIEPPVITLNGDQHMTLYLGETYDELGATAIDNVDGNVSVSIKGKVDTNKVGDYTVTYEATDKAGNTAVVQRIVTVQEKPKIALLFKDKASHDFATNNSSVLLEGYVYSNVDIDQVICINTDTGIEKTANGTEVWDVNISLQTGDNQIECTASLSDNELVSKKSVNVTYYANSSFVTPLEFEEDTFFVDETKIIKTHIGIEYNTSKDIITKLYEVDNNGSLKNTIFTMYDNGTLPDEIDKDGIFTVHATIDESNPSRHCYRVGVVYDSQNEFFSEIKCIKIVKHITQDQMENFMSIGEDIKKIYAENNDTKIAAQKAYDALVNDPRVGAMGINEDGESLWYVSVDGIAGGYSVFKEGTRSAPRVKSKKGLIISPYISNPNDIHNSWGMQGDDYTVVWQYIKVKKVVNLKQLQKR